MDKKKFIVFKGRTNGMDVDFLFDTGAMVGVANSRIVKEAQIESKSKKAKVKDSNNAKKEIERVQVDKIEIGSHTFTTVKDVSVDMSYLYCHNFYLLGQNVSKNLNWKIDFENKKIMFSKSSFSQTSSQSSIQIDKYKGKIPQIYLEFEGKKYLFLIDTGYAGFIDVDEKIDFLNQKVIEQQSKDLVKNSLKSSLGIHGFGKADSISRFEIDELKLGDIHLEEVPISIAVKEINKIGIAFFYTYFKSVVFNFSENTILLEPKYNIEKPKGELDIQIMYFDKKLKVIGKNLDPKSPASQFEIGEEVASINGKKAIDFKDECEFLRWYIAESFDIATIENNKGKIVKFGTTKL
ncbi:MAG: retroviral-like aspartic protease family protein [Leadbetterella sp.]